jgi:hypothetical protein
MINNTVNIVNIENSYERYTREHVVVVDTTRREVDDAGEWIEIPRITPGFRLKYTPQAGTELKDKGDKKTKSKSYMKLYERNRRAYETLIKRAQESARHSLTFESSLVPRDFRPQSGVEGVSLMNTTLNEKSQNISFSDQLETKMYVVDSEVDPTRRLQDSNDASLGNFFSRPIKIREYEWSTSSTLAEEFNPWQDFFENQRVIDRITTFNLLRCKLHVKAVINGNGFQYGRAVLAYNPLAVFDDLSTHSALVSADLVQTTQLPHVYLDPTTSAGGELLLPFFYHKNYLSIPDGDWTDMGQCYLRSLNALKHANGATDVVTISIFVWAEDVSLSVLTNTDFVAQSGNEVDEANKTGMISGPASVISKSAKTLSGISAIAPYAMATSKAADVIGGVAKMFGYCAPPITRAPDPFKPYNAGTLATTNTPQTVNKLTVDDKQELTIDPRIAGLSGDDPMNIRNIANRESYLTQFSWAIGTAPETLLWNTRVTPVTWAETGLTPQSYLFPPCAVASIPFKYWTGTMKYRFQIVCSTFHKGRIKLVYDPNHIDTVEYNTNYMKIVDISKEQDFTIEIGNGQPFTLLDHANPGADSVTEIYSTTNYTTNAPGNGTLAVYILNELTTPNSTANNDIQINVFVSAGDDFEVFVPDSTDITNFVFKPQSGMESSSDIVPESQGTTEPSAPMQEMSMSLGPGEQDLSDINKVFVGESIASFRPLLKRWALHATETLRTGNSYTVGIRCMMPYLRGNITDAVHLTVAAAPYNYCNTTLFHWVRYAFQGHRGSMRWRMMPRRTKTTADEYAIYMQRNPLGIGAEYVNASNTVTALPSKSEAAYNSVQAGISTLATAEFPTSAFDGTSFTNVIVNNVSEIEVPWYNLYRFSPGKEESYTGVETFDPTWRYHINSSNADGVLLDTWYSTGEDFQVYMWTGLPRMYYESAPPAPDP